MGEPAVTESLPEQDVTQTQRPRRLRLKLPRLTRAEKPADTSAEEKPAVVSASSPLAYKTFSPKIAPALTALGGILAIAGGLGAWVRAVQIETEGLVAEEVEVVMGYNDPEGLTIAVFGAVALLTSFFWLRRRPVWFKTIPAFVIKLIPILASLGVVGLVAWQLPLIDRQASAMAQEAVERLGFASFHAGLGWGAWTLVVAASALLLATIIGILREIDLRRNEQQGGETG
jgi:hypothetical protein